MITDYQLAHRLNAAAGWMELGNLQEARGELEGLPPEAQERAEVLEMHWVLNVAEENWEAALETAKRFTARFPENASGWLHQAYALRRVKEGGLEAAWDLLRPALDRFAGEPVIAYNLACYACQMRRLEEAQELLREAMRRDESGKQVKRMALADSDLEPLWEQIRHW